MAKVVVRTLPCVLTSKRNPFSLENVKIGQHSNFSSMLH